MQNSKLNEVEFTEEIMYAKLSSIILMLIIMHQPLLLNGLKQSFEDLEWQYFSITDEEITYLNSWAVQIKGSIDIANVVAEKYGFVNRGKVGLFVNNNYNYYVIIMHILV